MASYSFKCNCLTPLHFKELATTHRLKFYSVDILCGSERAELQQSRSYEQIMMQLENNMKGSAARCRSVDCDNYGNSRCEGYCHECYHVLQITRRY